MASCQNNEKPKASKVLTIDLLNKQLDENPKDLTLLEKRAKYYDSKANYSAAITDLQTALNLAPDSVCYYLQLADLFLKTGSISNTMGLLKKVTELDPQNDEAFLKIGEINLMYKKYADVFTNANKALEINPYNDKAYFLKAYTYKEMGDTNRAIDNFQQCLKNNPNHYESNIELGILFMKIKNDLAITYFKNAINIDSTKVDAYYDLGLYYQSSDYLNEAIGTYKKIIKINPNFPNSYYNIGYIYLELLNISDKSIPYFSQAIKVSPNYYEAYFNRALAFEKLGDVLNAKEDYKAALRINPNYEAAQLALSRVESNINLNN